MDPEPKKADEGTDDEFIRDMVAVVDEESEPQGDADVPPGGDEGKAATDDDPSGGEGEPGEDLAGGEEEGGDDDESSVDDSLLERAVRAGMTLNDAKAVGSADALGRILDRLEVAAGKADGDGEGGDGESGDEPNILDSIPDLDPDEYSDDVVAAFSGMKKAIADQQNIINGLLSKAEALASGDSSDDGESSGEDIAAKKRSEMVRLDAAKKRSEKALNRPRDANGQFLPDTDSDEDADLVNTVSEFFEDV